MFFKRLKIKFLYFFSLLNPLIAASGCSCFQKNYRPGRIDENNLYSNEAEPVAYSYFAHREKKALSFESVNYPHYSHLQNSKVIDYSGESMKSVRYSRARPPMKVSIFIKNFISTGTPACA